LKNLKLILATLLLSNPFILYMLSNSLTVAILVPLLTIVSVVYIKDRFKKSPKIFIYSFNFIAIFFLMAHFELVFRVSFDDYSIDNWYKSKKTYYLNKPFLNEEVHDLEFDAIYKTNIDGFRIHESSDPNESIKSCDWLVLGDSYTQGAQVNFSDLYTSQLYRNFPDKIIINFGISGLGIGQEFEILKNEGIDLDPSVLLIQICNFNDFMNVKPSKLGWQSKLVEVSELFRFFYFNMIYQSPGELPMGRWTEPFYPSEQKNIDYNIFYKPTSEQKENDILDFRKYFKLLVELARENDIEPIFLQIPTKEQVYYRFLDEVVTGYNLDIDNLDLFKPNRILKELTDSFNVRYIDLYYGFIQNQNQLFFDFDEHLNPEGHKVMTQIITDSLNSWGITSSCELISSDFDGDRYYNENASNGLGVYQSTAQGNMELFTVDLMTMERSRLTYNLVDDLHPMVNDEGSHIIFTRGDPSSGNLDVYWESLNGTEILEISNRHNEYGAIPYFSNDNNKIVYASWVVTDSGQSNSDIVVYNLKTNSHQTIIKSKDEKWRPSFSPGDSLITYIARHNSNYDLFYYNLNTDSSFQITNTSYDEWDPVFSTDSRRILHAAKKDGNWDLFEYSLETKITQRITRTNGDEWDPFYRNDSVILYSGAFGPFKSAYSKIIQR